MKVLPAEVKVTIGAYMVLQEGKTHVNRMVGRRPKVCKAFGHDKTLEEAAKKHFDDLNQFWFPRSANCYNPDKNRVNASVACSFEHLTVCCQTMIDGGHVKAPAAIRLMERHVSDLRAILLPFPYLRTLMFQVNNSDLVDFDAVHLVTNVIYFDRSSDFRPKEDVHLLPYNRCGKMYEFVPIVAGMTPPGLRKTIESRHESHHTWSSEPPSITLRTLVLQLSTTSLWLQPTF